MAMPVCVGLTEKIPNVERARTTLSNIVRAGQRAGEIIDSIRAISKKEHRVRAPISVNELIREVLALVEAELQTHHIAVQTTLTEANPEVLADRARLRQVMLNLIENAIEAMRFPIVSTRVLHLKTELDGSQNIIVAVQELWNRNGCEKTSSEYLERFFTTKTQGTGMGLTICRSIIESHNGHLWAEAGLGQGSVFWILLPTRADIATVPVDV